MTETGEHVSVPARDVDLDARELVPPPPLSVKQVAWLFLRTWPHLKPVAWHVVGWFTLAMVIGLISGYVTITGVDLFTNAVLNGQPIAPLQRLVLFLDPRDVRRAGSAERLLFLHPVPVDDRDRHAHCALPDGRHLRHGGARVDLGVARHVPDRAPGHHPAIRLRASAAS